MTKIPDSPSLELTIPGSASDHHITPECVPPFFSLVLCNNNTKHGHCCGILTFRKVVCLTEEIQELVPGGSGQLRCPGSR